MDNTELVKRYGNSLDNLIKTLKSIDKVIFLLLIQGLTNTLLLASIILKDAL